MFRGLGGAFINYLNLRGRIQIAVFALVSAACALSGAISLGEAVDFYFKAEHAEGRVIDVTEQHHRAGGIDYFEPASRIEFTTADGNLVTWYETNNDSDVPRETGQRVDMLYFPDSPGQARINSFSGLFGNGSILILVGFTLMFVCFPRWFLRWFGSFRNATVVSIVGGLICGAGLMLLAGAWFATLGTRVVDAHIAELGKIRLQDERNIAYDRYRPRLQFQTEDGLPHEIILNRAYAFPPYLIGESAEVRYSVSNPDRAALENPMDRWGLGIVVFGLGALYLTIGLLPVLFTRLFNRPSRSGIKSRSAPKTRPAHFIAGRK